MKTSSIVAAVVLTVASLSPAMAGSWVVAARPTFFPPMHMVAPPFHPGPARFGPINHFRPMNRFEPFGGFGFHRPLGQVVTFFPTGEAGPTAAPLSGVAEPAEPRIIWAPSYVTVVASPRCGYGNGRLAGGPKIIVIGAPPPSTHDEKLPVVIYGAHGDCSY